jgi:glycolate dehydrogenase FAD-binding subunit
MGSETVMPAGRSGAIFPAGGAPTVHAPTTTADVADVVRQSRATRTTLRIAAGATWLDAGRPVVADARLDISALAGIVEYVPGDLTLTARAGTPLALIVAATAAHGQWLPLDAPAMPRTTLGATLATASCGPLAATIGNPRDLTVGVEFVTGTADVVRGGGRVVKNVAGFDLVRLVIGAWGTLGVLTEATVRLRALPECDVSLALAAEDPAQRPLLLRTLHEGGVAPLAADLVDAALAAEIGLPRTTQLLVRLVGNEASVAAQRRVLASVSDAVEAGPDAWLHLCAADPPAAFTCRVSRRPSEFGALWDAVGGAMAACPGMVRHGSVARGVVRCIAPPGEAAALSSFVRLAAEVGRCIVERAPAPAWPLVSSAATHRLARGIRLAFDPDRLLNPGILGDVGP